MSIRSRKLYLPLASTLALAALAPSSASASGGGTLLPFNGPLTTVVDNLTGPTASAISTAIALGSLVIIGFSRENNGLMKTIGGSMLVCALIAKLPEAMSVLGISGATGSPDLGPTLFACATAVVAACIAVTLGFAFYPSSTTLVDEKA